MGSGKLVKFVKSRKSRKRHSIKVTPGQVRGMVKRVLSKRETPHHNDAIFIDDFISTGTLTNLTSISQGDDVVTRQGDRIEITRFYGNVNCMRNPDATAVAYDPCRFIIFQWHPDNSEDPPSEAKLLESPSYWMTSPTCLDKELNKKFTVIVDRKMYLGALLPSLGATDNKPVRIHFDWRPKGKNAIMDFSPNTPAIGTNLLYCYARGANANGTDDSDFEFYGTTMFNA